MQIARHVIVLDAPDLDAESSFWAAVFGCSVDTSDDWHSVLVDGRPVLEVQLAPDHVAPDWPSNTVPQQLHLDLYVPELAAAHEEVMALGARLLQPAAEPDGTFIVYADPAGHPFCLCRA